MVADFALEIRLLLLGMLASVLLESTHCSQVQGKNTRLARFNAPAAAIVATLLGLDVRFANDTRPARRFSADLRSTNFYSPDPSGGPTEEISIREFNVLLGYSF